MEKMKKLAIIGASYLQNPLIEKANQRGIETHVFAYKDDAIGEETAFCFYPISIIEKDAILEKCQEIGIDGICTISSDLAVVTVNYVAEKMGLIGNSIEATINSTNKFHMRQRFFENNDPSPKSYKVQSSNELVDDLLTYPVIVKPLDRSGSRGITKVFCFSELEDAICHAQDQGFEKSALVEEFVEGDEYSVEYISWRGNHHFLAITKKHTTGSPHFIETGHVEPALLSAEITEKIKKIVSHALTGLGIQYGASHSEIKITEAGVIQIIEIAGRMGGDFIGSSLVELTTGFDYLSAVINISLGIEPKVKVSSRTHAAIRFIFNQNDLNTLETMKRDHPEIIVDYAIFNMHTPKEVTDSSHRYGYYIFSSSNRLLIEEYLPDTEASEQ